MRKGIVIIKQFSEKKNLKRLGLKKLSHSSEMQNNALKHREGSKELVAS